MTLQGKPANSPRLVPYLTVKDADRAIDFYTRAFGFALRDAVKDEAGRTGHVEMTWKDVLIMFAPEGAYGSPVKSPATLGITSPVTLFVYTESVDALCAQALLVGATVAIPPTDMFWGDRMCSLIDPDGYTWNFATHTGKTFEMAKG